jgi:hypothetical protein
MPKARKVFSSDRSSVSAGKNALAMNGANSAKTVKSNHSSALPTIAVAMARDALVGGMEAIC